MFHYLNPNASPDEIRAEYRRLAQLHHPDHNASDKPGATVRMQQINAEYAAAMATATRRAKPGKTEAEYADLDRVNETIRAAIEAIIKCPGLQIEICGWWVWVGGETRAHKETLKAAGYKWASKKEKWYFAGIAAGSRGQWDMQRIRDHYGSQAVHTRKDDEQPRRQAGSLA